MTSEDTVMLPLPTQGAESFSLWESLYLISFNRTDNFIYTLAFCQTVSVAMISFVLHSWYPVPRGDLSLPASGLWVFSSHVAESRCSLPRSKTHKSVDQRDEEYSHSLEARRFLLFTNLPPKILIKSGDVLNSCLWVYFPFLKKWCVPKLKQNSIYMNIYLGRRQESTVWNRTSVITTE